MISPLGQQITDEIKCHLLELTHMISEKKLINTEGSICGTQMFIFMQVYQQAHSKACGKRERQ